MSEKYKLPLLPSEILREKEIKRLAKKSLEEKWYPLDIDKAKLEEWVSNCAFCVDGKVRQYNNEFRCKRCYLNDLPICDSIDEWHKEKDKSVIIKALEELAETGKLSKETEIEVAME